MYWHLGYNRLGLKENRNVFMGVLYHCPNLYRKGILTLDLHYNVSRAFVMRENSVKEEEKRKKVPFLWFIP
jgi:hypothetical protein